MINELKDILIGVDTVALLTNLGFTAWLRKSINERYGDKIKSAGMTLEPIGAGIETLSDFIASALKAMADGNITADEMTGFYNLIAKVSDKNKSVTDETVAN